MTIVSLGSLPVSTGTGFVTFNSFNYNQRRAYGIYLICTSSSFTSIFSFIRVRSLFAPNNASPFIESTKYDFDIIPEQQFFFLPCSRLFGADGDCTFLVERIPIWRGAGDGQPISVELSYDDDEDIPSWRD